MGATARFGVSLDEDLLEAFDDFCAHKGYTSRSKALRNMIRQALMDDAKAIAGHETAGVLTLVYDHHSRELAKKLTKKQHEDHDCVVATLHIHLSQHTCLEVLMLKGEAEHITRMADALRAIKGVKHGTFTLLPVESIPC